MSGQLTTAVAECLAGCGWSVSGDPATVDREAQKHFTSAPSHGREPGHSVAVTVTPLGGMPEKAKRND